MKLTIILFFSIFTVIGQNIKGSILEIESLKPLANVNVYFKKEKVGTISDENGIFSLITTNRVKETDSISFSILGYEPKQYTLLKLAELNFKVYLFKKTEHLDEVTVTSKRQLKPEITFKKLSPLIKGVYNFDSAIIGDKIYLVGGNETTFKDTAKKALNESSDFAEMGKKLKSNLSWENYSDKLQIYNITKNAWETVALKFKNRAYHKIAFSNNNIYVFGGKTLSTNRKIEYLNDQIEVFNLETTKIVVDNTNPHQAVNFGAFTYQDNIILMGGSIKQNSRGQKNYTDQSHIYNTTSGLWYELTKMTKPKEVNGILVKNKIYLIGGFNEKALTEIESYDLITGKWTHMGDLFYGIENPVLTYNEGVIYIFDAGKIMTYNIESKVLNAYRIDLNLSNAEINYYENNLYIMGGLIQDDYTKSPSSELYLINTNEFVKTEIKNWKNN